MNDGLIVGHFLTILFICNPTDNTTWGGLRHNERLQPLVKE